MQWEQNMPKFFKANELRNYTRARHAHRGPDVPSASSNMSPRVSSKSSKSHSTCLQFLLFRISQSKAHQDKKCTAESMLELVVDEQFDSE